LPPDPQPDRVVQYFPTTGPVDAGLDHGHDPRQHAVALVHAVVLSGEPTIVRGGEALDFRWWGQDELAGLRDVWPGTLQTVRGALRR
jgi:ADP-ribose pyrophosphatase YjhB (NUDIX family)